MSARVLLRAVAGNLYFTVTLYSSDTPFVGALCIKYVNWGYQNNDQSVSLIPKQDPGIPGLQISQFWILGLRIQSLDCNYSSSSVLAHLWNNRATRKGIRRTLLQCYISALHCGSWWYDVKKYFAGDCFCARSILCWLCHVFVAIGITNQRETTIVWDRLTGLPLYNAIGLYTFCYFASSYIYSKLMFEFGLLFMLMDWLDVCVQFLTSLDTYKIHFIILVWRLLAMLDVLFLVDEFFTVQNLKYFVLRSWK